MKKDRGSPYPAWAVLMAFATFAALSAYLGFEPGMRSASNFLSFVKSMVGLLPPAFLLVGLFNAWVKRETVEKHLGKDSGVMGYFWAIVLAGTMVGGLYVALPLCVVLQRKGASLGILLTFLNAAAVCRVPMTIFEASFLGIGFTVIRFAASIPLVILTARAISSWLGEDFRITGSAGRKS